MFSAIRMVTHCVASLDAIEAAYTGWLNYSVAARSTVSEALAGAWETPGAAGLPVLLLRPASGEDVFLRFIETGANLPFGQPLYCGWNATEILCEDPDELTEQLRSSPFAIVGEPIDLYDDPTAPRAMQATGPAGELLYFTRIPDGNRFGLHQAKAFVDRVFIVVAGGPSIDDLRSRYSDSFGLTGSEPREFRIPMLADACGVSQDTAFPTSVAGIPGERFMVEMDAYPDVVQARPNDPTGLPPGMAMVSFTQDTADTGSAVSDPGYDGLVTRRILGAAGEWIELLSPPPA